MEASHVPHAWKGTLPPFALQADSDVGLRLRAALQAKLPEYLGCESEDILPEYITVMLAHGKSKAATATDLEAFLGKEGAVTFTRWLWAHCEVNKNNYLNGAPLVEVDLNSRRPKGNSSGAAKTVKEEVRDSARNGTARRAPLQECTQRRGPDGELVADLPPARERRPAPPAADVEMRGPGERESTPPAEDWHPGPSGRLRSQVVVPAPSGQSPPQQEGRGAPGRRAQERARGREWAGNGSSRGRGGGVAGAEAGVWDRMGGRSTGGGRSGGQEWNPRKGPPPPPSMPPPPFRPSQIAPPPGLALPAGRQDWDRTDGWGANGSKGDSNGHGKGNGNGNGSGHSGQPPAPPPQLVSSLRRCGTPPVDIDIPRRPNRIACGKRPRTPTQEELSTFGGDRTPPMRHGTPPLKRRSVVVGPPPPSGGRHGTPPARRIMVQAVREATEGAYRPRTVEVQVPVRVSVPIWEPVVTFDGGSQGKRRADRADWAKARDDAAAAAAPAPFSRHRIVTVGRPPPGFEPAEVDGAVGADEAQQLAAAEAAHQRAVGEMKHRMRKLEMQLLALKAQKHAEEQDLLAAARLSAAVPGARPPPKPTHQPGTVMVANVPPLCSPEVLRAHFSVCGEVLRATVLKDKVTQQPKGTAMVEFVRWGSAKAAAKQLGGSVLLGQVVSVALLKPRN